jgi:hypothetical protein
MIDYMIVEYMDGVTGIYADLGAAPERPFARVIWVRLRVGPARGLPEGQFYSKRLYAV